MRANRTHVLLFAVCVVFWGCSGSAPVTLPSGPLIDAWEETAKAWEATARAWEEQVISDIAYDAAGYLPGKERVLNAARSQASQAWEQAALARKQQADARNSIGFRLNLVREAPSQARKQALLAREQVADSEGKMMNAQAEASKEWRDDLALWERAASAQGISRTMWTRAVSAWDRTVRAWDTLSVSADLTGQ